MIEDPEYSERLGLAIESHFFENILVNKEDKEKSEKHYGKQKHS